MNRIVEREHLEERFLDNGGSNFREAAIELEKFFDITRTFDAPLAMINPNIDLLWHSFIEFTEDYQDYCKRTLGKFVHHRPRTARTPVPPEAILNFVEQYEKKYGSMPAVWLKDTPVEVLDYAQRRTNKLPENLKWSGWPGPEA